MFELKNKIVNKINEIREQLIDISDYIYNNPELGNQENKALEKLTSFLKKNNFSVETGIVDKPTAFKAEYRSQKEGPNIAFLCEYDALPVIGHGCGHNMIGTMSAGAAVALSTVLDEIGGKITVLGTPAEECDGAKVVMAEKGVFDGVDAAMILHPSQITSESGNSLAMDAIEFHFKGKASHAAAEPEAGINALDAVLLTFNGINALRQHVASDVRIHGIIKEGGVAANIVPDSATAQFYVRALSREYLNEVAEKVKNVARGAAQMTGATLDISNYEVSYDNMKTNKALSKVFNSNLKLAGEPDVAPAPKNYGSIDMGNVSYVVPSIHPHIGIGCGNAPSHSKEFADATVTQTAHEALVKGASALALTGYDVICDADLMEEIKKEFNS